MPWAALSFFAVRRRKCMLWRGLTAETGAKFTLGTGRMTSCAETIYSRGEDAILEHVTRKTDGMRASMKVRIEIQEELEEEEVIIRCGSLNDSVVGLQDLLSKQSNAKRCLRLTRGETEYYIPVAEIYFLETEGREIRAHTAGQIFACGYRLYELEELLPGNFMRISKSCIANLDHIYSITRNLTASSEVEFSGSPKKALVSRSYYKALAERLNAKKLGL